MLRAIWNFFYGWWCDRQIRKIDRRIIERRDKIYRR